MCECMIVVGAVYVVRITEYADRLLESLKHLEFSDAMKEMQTNWIGKSSGAEINFSVQGSGPAIRVYTTRPDTIFGADFLVLAPEHPLVAGLITGDRSEEAGNYVEWVKSRSERERMAEKKISGAFTGSYVLHPFTGKPLPVWISEYVLAGYGTGAIMAVPSGDERDFKFARHFGLPITNIWGEAFDGEAALTEKDLRIQDSDFLNGLSVKEAIEKAVDAIEQKGIGKRRTNYKMRDAAFSRQRYWGEPFPISWENGIAKALPESELPLELPYVEQYKAGPDGEGPLANIDSWTARHLETSTMPGYAGSSWYFLRYMDPHNDSCFANRKFTDYWQQVDVYIGGTEHAVGHLLYSRMWTKALFDLGHIGFDEPFKKLVNQGMIQGSSRFVYRLGKNLFVSSDRLEHLDAALLEKHGIAAGEVPAELRVDVSLVDGLELDVDAFKSSRPEYADAEFLLNNEGIYLCTAAVEKMSKSKYNVVNPDDIVLRYGADTFRMYEMFLGPIDVSKPWDTQGIEGVHRFLKKLWRLFFAEGGANIVTDEPATAAELKSLHKTLKKTEEDVERFSFNTAVSQFMICVNELSALGCHKREILEPLCIAITPFAPHLAEELWQQLGHKDSVLDAAFPQFDEQHLRDSTKLYPVAINGKTRAEMEFSLDASQDLIEKEVLADAGILKWLDNKPPKKIIFVKGKMINIVA